MVDPVFTSPPPWWQTQIRTGFISLVSLSVLCCLFLAAVVANQHQGLYLLLATFFGVTNGLILGASYYIRSESLKDSSPLYWLRFMVVLHCHLALVVGVVAASAWWGLHGVVFWLPAVATAGFFLALTLLVLRPLSLWRRRTER